MKWNFKLILMILLVCIGANLGAEILPFDKEIFHPNRIIVCFQRDFVKDISGKIDFDNNGGIVSTGSATFNQLARQFKITDLEQMHPFVRDMEWNDDGAYIQNIYRVYIKDNEMIEEARSALEKFHNIIYAEYDSIVHTLYVPNDPFYNNLWFIDNTYTNLAWNFVQGSDEVIVAITDTGTKWNHEDLADNIWINEAELPGITIDWVNGLVIGGDGLDNDGNGKIDDVIGWDFVDNNNNPQQNFPGNQHGTHVAGCAGAVGDNNIGVTGTAMNVSLLICKGGATNHNSSGVQYAYDQVIYSADSGAHFINCSWISYGYSGAYPNQIVNYATAQGSLVIAGAGNQNTQHTAAYGGFPSDCTNSVSVAATDQDDIKASFSDFGTPIDISAPGVSIYSTYYNNSGNDSYQWAQGTSMSSPIVAGIAALVKTANPGLGPLEIKDRLIYTADCIDNLNPSHAGLLGGGRVNAFRAALYDRIPYITMYSHNVQEYEGDGDGVPNPGEIISMVIGLENDFYFTDANDVIAMLSTDVDGVTILNPTVSFPNIGGGAIVFNTNDPFLFETDPYMSNINIPFTLTILANQQGYDYPYFTEISLNIQLSLEQANWPQQLPGSTTSSPLIEDLNNDGTQHIIFGDTQGYLHCLDADRQQAEGFPVHLGSNISSAVAIGDLTNDGNKEICAVRMNGFVHLVDHSGEELFVFDSGGQIRANPMIGSLTENGEMKIIILTFGNPRIIVLNNDGTIYQEYLLDSQVLSSSALGDVSGDGNNEVIFVTNDGNLHAKTLHTGVNIEGFPVNLGAASWHGPIAGNILKNNNTQIAVATVTGKVFLIDYDGSIVFERNINNQIRASVVAGDITGDGNTELVFSDIQGNIFLVDTQGEDLNGFPISIGTMIESTPVLADLTFDSRQEIIFGGQNGYIFSITADGDNSPNFPYYLGGSIVLSPVIGDVDNDDDLDIIIGNDNAMHFIDYKRAAGGAKWLCFKGDSYRRGNISLITLETEDTLANNLSTAILGNYPNPFNPQTQIKFSVAVAGRASISIFNLKGQKIRTFNYDYLEPGTHTAVWDGKNENGREVSSGTYFFRLKSKDGVDARKMLLLK